MNHSLVSIALCTYNGEKHLVEQLETLVHQSYAPLELIIVDDASSDKTMDIVNAYADAHSFIKVFRNPQNLGYIKNFERAITLTTGQFIALCDQDDVWELDKIEKMMAKIGSYEMIYHDSDFIDEDGAPMKDKMSDYYRFHQGDSNLPFLISNCVAGHAMLFKRALLPHILPFNKDFHHDWWIAFVASTIGHIKAIPEVMVHYRQHLNSITDSLGLKSDDNSSGDLYYFDLEWIAHCLTFDNKRNPKEVAYFYRQLSAFKHEETGFRLFYFLMKYYKVLHFLHGRKSFLSTLNRMRKVSFTKRYRGL